MLLVDGHTSHINVQTAEFFKDNDIHLYCLPSHSSHITQPLDVGFFKGLKDSWRKSCQQYISAHPGHFVTKQGSPAFSRKHGTKQSSPSNLSMPFVLLGFTHSTSAAFLKVDLAPPKCTLVLTLMQSNARVRPAPPNDILVVHLLSWNWCSVVKRYRYTRQDMRRGMT